MRLMRATGVMVLMLWAATALGQLGSFQDFGRQVPVPAAAAGSPTPDILWWKFTDGSGSTITATVGPNGTTDCSWVTGKSGAGYALQGNGSTQEGSSVSDITFGTNIITVAVWVKATVNWNFGYILKGQASSNSVDMFNNNFPRFSIAGSTGGRTETIANPETNVWVHFLAVYDATASGGVGDIAIYTNGVLSTTGISANTKTGSSNFEPQKISILSQTVAGVFRFTCQFDDLRIYSGDRSADAVAIRDDPQ